MSEDLHNYIRQARQNGADHQTIKDRLVGAGWHPQTVGEALDMHQPALAATHNKTQMPIAVVQALSTRGVEYYLMMIALVVSAISLGLVLHSIAAQLFSDSTAYSFNTSVMSFASSALVVSLPLFIFFFLRLKKAELRTPSLLADPSRRRAIQIVLITSFVFGLLSTASYVFAFFSLSYGGTDTEGESISLLIADFVIATLIIGGIFANYWMDSHQKGER